MTVEDSAKLGAGVALVAFGLHLIVRSFPSAVAVEYRGTTQKAHHRNDRLLGGVNVTPTEGKPSQSCQANNDATKKQCSVETCFDAVALKGGNSLTNVVIDDGCPVDDRGVFRRVLRRVGLWLIAHSGSSVVENQKSTLGGAA